MSFFLLILCFLTSHITSRANDIAYYWQPFNGTIPDDAVEGGILANYRLTAHIGRAFYAPDVLVPGFIEIFPSSVLNIVVDDATYEIKDGIEVLCSSHPDRFEWIKTNYTEISYLDRGNFVVGGYDKRNNEDYSLIVARKPLTRFTPLGYVRLHSDDEGISYVLDQSVPRFDRYDFEVLTYNGA